MPARCPELFVEEGTVSVGGDLKFSRGVQDLKGTRAQRGGTDMPNLVFCFLVFLWQICLWITPLQPSPWFLCGK